ncbi:SusC/RagA family TonB-linked outer membrane protein [Chryseolinea sp. H1M3-3]|uniref:SusC/RagA family TonB-linked outer membrane protein n=1 Tax=Chryseolinea sp. H1M3-3 TaxID=3034144 RepID=UPI0023EAB54B|nr:SusC/RagA family TonB-linked outer membrane protein [Chryseolinea sp. H1M3-3]
MKCQYLLIGIFLLISYEALPQHDEVYAAASPRAVRLESYSLKQGLKEVEKSFNVSIAYKDEWVENKLIQPSKSSFKSAEEALDMMLRQTTLYYEKGGDRFYVIYQKKSVRKPIAAEPTASISTTPLLFSFPSASTGDYLAERLATRQQKNEVAITISGKVTDENGADFPGVNVLVKGTSVGTSTDINGRYSVEVPDENAVLVFSFIGYATQEITVGSRTTIDLRLDPDVKSLEEVVVTALGIEKSSKSLGYATSTVNADQLTINRTPNIMNSLQGKIAGVNISGLGTGPGGTSKIRIRGQSSFTGQNNPLIVVNGVPIDNTNFGTNPTSSGSVGGDNAIATRGGGVTSDGGDGLQSINPDDVESMTVLKGATAAALYGYRAKDGVIMITTKTKGDGRGLGLTYNLNYTNDQPLDFTDYQYEYGQGENGVRPTNPNPTSGQWSFGEKFQPGMTQVLFDGVTVPYEPQRNHIKDFFRNGQTMTNTLSMSSGGEKGGFNLSLANMDSKGIVPNNSFTRRSINLGFNYSLSEKLSVKGSINYSNEYNKNAPNVGNQDNTIPVALYAMANSMPLWLLNEKKYNAQGNEFVYSRFMNRTNPYFTLAEQFHNTRRDRVFGNISLRYDLTDWLYVQGRIGQDYWSRTEDYNNFPTGQASRAAAPAGFVNGMYTQDARNFRELNADWLIGSNKSFGDFALSVNVGGNQMYRRSELNSVQVTDFVVRDLYTVQNGRVKDPLYTLGEEKVNSLYGSAEVSYKDFLFLSATGRNDWFSVLSKGNRSTFYPSISLGYVFLENTSGFLNFGKLRVAYAEVGSNSDVAPYSTLLYYGINNNFLANPSGAPQPLGGPTSTTLPNRSLRPMTVTETEVGLELKMLKNRLNIDVAAYQKITTDQIVQAQVSDASGYVDTRINSGESRNRGVELMLNIVPIETSDFVWDFTFNGSYNITKVLKITTDTPGERITVGTHVFNGELRHIVGEELGQIAGFGYQRNNGQIIYGANGIPLATSTFLNFGSALPKWVGGFTNSLTYKGISFSFLIDFKLGNKMLSGTNFNAYRHGLHKETLAGRESGVVGQGVNEAGEPNTVAVFPVQPFYEVVRSKGLIEPVIYNGGYWKLRQITLGYDFTKFLPENFPVKGVRLSLVANNVLMLKKWIPNIDPESFGYSSDNLIGMESTGLPTTRNMGFNLNVKF